MLSTCHNEIEVEQKGNIDVVASIKTVAFQGIDVQPVDVQVQISNGLPAFTIVGLPDKAVAESKERVRAALHALGLSLPPKRLMNLPW